MVTTKLRSCNLCEAGCGLVLEVEDNRVVAVRPDEDDPVSHGYVCPKGMAIADVHHDPDRLRRPMRRDANGAFHEISWEEAFDLVGTRLRAIRAAEGPDAIALYYGNPLVHNYGGILTIGALIEAIGTKNRTSASSQDTAPRFGASYYLYGNTLVTPVPDVDRTDWFLCVGGNPAVSQGSGMVTPNIKGRLRGIQERGGTIITVDPRFSETAKLADEHVFIRPGGDAALLIAMASVMIEDDLLDQEAVRRDTAGFEHVRSLVAGITPERVVAATGIEAATIRRLAHDFATAERGVVYTRLGICNNAHGTLATWATDLLNVLGGRLGKVGGAMFPEPCLDGARGAQMLGLNGHGRWHSRVRHLPETASDLPAAMLAEEMETPGPGQIRAMVTVAGNPVLSTPNGRRLGRAIEGLEFMVSVDIYVNETSRHADVILPPCWSLAEDHCPPVAPSLSLETNVRCDPPAVEREEGELAEWEILVRLAEEMGGGPTTIGPVNTVMRWLGKLGWRFDPSRTLDLLLRVGPHGDRFLPWSGGVNLAKVKAEARGLQLPAAPEGVKHRVFHKDGLVHLDGAPIVAELEALDRELNQAATNGHLLLIGRRHLRSNNSWMHNIDALVRGKDRCVLLVNPEDATRVGLRDSEPALLQSRTHSAEVPVRVTDEMMPGVVSLPHGWGHAENEPWQRVASEHAGVSANDWTDDQLVESVVGQSILNGVPVTVSPAPERSSS